MEGNDAVKSPCAFFISCGGEYSNRDIVKEIIGKDTLPEPKSLVENIEGFRWTINNKYYSAEILLCISDSKTVGNKDFASRVEAVVIHFDATSAESFSKVKQWTDFTRHLGADIQILAGDVQRGRDKTSADKLHRWCLQNNFELVDMKPPETDEEEEEDGEEDGFMRESYGMRRIVEALHAHQWPNLVMKNRSEARVGASSTGQASESSGVAGLDGMAGLSISGLSAMESKAKDLEGSRKSGESARTNLPDDEEAERRVLEVLAREEGAADEGPGSFELVFDKLSAMKAKAATLEGDERKQYAETIVRTFWEAIGGDPAEMDHLDEDSD